MDSEAFLAEYDRRAEELHRFTAACERELHTALDPTGVVRAITSRVKSRQSVQNKLLRPDRRYEQFGEMVDLAGTRVVTMLAEDVPVVVEALERSFDVDGEQCWDMSWVLGTEDFGYRSVHYVVAPKTGGWPRDLKCEVQVRSLLQDAWAQIAHGLSYKSLLSVPQDEHRRLSLAAGLLEVADREFGQVRAATARYRRKIEAAANAAGTEGIDGAAVARLLVSDEVLFGIDRAIAADAESALLAAPSQQPEKYSQMLAHAGFQNVAEAKSRLAADADAVRSFASAVIKRGRRPRILYRGVSLFHLCSYVAAVQGEAALEQYLARTGMGLPAYNRSIAPDFVRIAQRVAAQQR
jgi:putative GTP pyrophosphokinase